MLLLFLFLKDFYLLFILILQFKIHSFLQESPFSFYFHLSKVFLLYPFFLKELSPILLYCFFELFYQKLIFLLFHTLHLFLLNSEVKVSQGLKVIANSSDQKKLFYLYYFDLIFFVIFIILSLLFLSLIFHFCLQNCDFFLS